MICFTIEQAAERVHRKPRTIQKWIRDGLLFAVKNPIDGQVYVEEERLLIAERDQRKAQGVTRFAYSQVGTDSATLQSS